GPDVAADLDVVDEIALRHDRGRHVGRHGRPRVHDGGRDRDHDDRRDERNERAPLRGRGHRTATAAFPATVPPSSRPPLTTTPCVFMAPSVTSWRSNEPPRFTRT